MTLDEKFYHFFHNNRFLLIWKNDFQKIYEKSNNWIIVRIYLEINMVTIIQIIDGKETLYMRASRSYFEDDFNLVYKFIKWN